MNEGIGGLFKSSDIDLNRQKKNKYIKFGIK